MKKTFFSLLTLLISIFLTLTFRTASASTSNVSVSNSVNTGGNSTTNSKTDIRIESNGEVKEYHSDTGESVSIESSDGSAKVNVSNKIGGSVKSEKTSSVENTVKVDVDTEKEDESKEEKENEIKEKEVKEKETKFDLLEFIIEKLPFLSFLRQK